MAYKTPNNFIWQFSNPGQTSAGVTMQLARVCSTNSNPPGFLPSTLTGNGYGGGNIDPYRADTTFHIVKAGLQVVGIAPDEVAAAVCDLRIDLFTHDYSSRTLLETLTFKTTNQGDYNNTSTNNFARYDIENLDIRLEEGDLVGAEFVPIGGADPTKINAARGLYLTLSIHED